MVVAFVWDVSNADVIVVAGSEVVVISCLLFVVLVESMDTNEKKIAISIENVPL